MRISVVIPTFNDEEHLERVLESVKDFDETVVCDAGSTDRTLEIAERAGARVVRYKGPASDGRAAATAFAVQQARFTWVFVVNPDELVPVALHDYIRAFIQNPEGFAGLIMPRKNYVLHKFSRSTYPDYQLRMFRREGASWNKETDRPRIEGKARKIPASSEHLALIHIAQTLSDTLRRFNVRSESEAGYLADGQGVSLFTLLFSPAASFLDFYLAKGGFKFGRTGYIQAKKRAYYRFMVLSKIIENEGRRRFWEEIDRSGTVRRP